MSSNNSDDDFATKSKYKTGIQMQQGSSQSDTDESSSDDSLKIIISHSDSGSSSSSVGSGDTHSCSSSPKVDANLLGSVSPSGSGTPQSDKQSSDSDSSTPQSAKQSSISYTPNSPCSQRSSGAAQSEASSPPSPNYSPNQYLETEKNLSGDSDVGSDIFGQIDDISDEELINSSLGATSKKKSDKQINLNIPHISLKLSEDINFIKFPNFLSVKHAAFDAETYEDEIDEEEITDEEGNQRIKLRICNTIRHREILDRNGQIKRESNARLVVWSDESMSLHLGDEMFEVFKQPLNSEHNHLFVLQGKSLIGQTTIETKLTFRPESIDSNTHKKMAVSLADRVLKPAGIRMLTKVGTNPTADLKLKLKKEEIELRQTIRRQNKAQRKKPPTKKLTKSYKNDDEIYTDEENLESLEAIKNRYKRRSTSNRKDFNIDSTDDEDSDFEARPTKKLTGKSKHAKALLDSDSE